MSELKETIEVPHGTVQTFGSDGLSRLYVQAIDAYGFQRELTIRSDGVGYECLVYQHPGRREIFKVSQRKGREFIKAFVKQVKEYPVLMFNDTGYPASATQLQRPRHEGFVRLCEQLHRGEPLSPLL